MLISLIIFIGYIFSQSNNDIIILSWNIKMFNGPYGWFHNQIERSDNIVKELNQHGKYDIILFQEAFSKSIRHKMYNELKKIYPYQNQPYTNIFGKENSGLWVISKSPITLIDEIEFTKKKSWDFLSAKGAKLYLLSHNGQNFYIINTHMQADYIKKYNDVRVHQYTEIYEKLILSNFDNKIPLILCGDLNISSSNHLTRLLEKLSIENGPILSKMKFSITGNNPKLLDYILVKCGNFKFKNIERIIIETEKNSYLYSDHFPIKAKLIW